ncbi:hypothetical protein ZP9_00041 [Shewanella phage ZP9]|nr:hypothetical protein ZP9_00041 [Shewanella phage ZP9]
MDILNNLAQTFCLLALVSIFYIWSSGEKASQQPDWFVYITTIPIILAVILTSVGVIANIWS